MIRSDDAVHTVSSALHHVSSARHYVSSALHHVSSAAGDWVCLICDPDDQWQSGDGDAGLSDPSLPYKVIKRRDKKMKKEKCATPGCDGSGNVNGVSATHRK